MDKFFAMAGLVLMGTVMLSVAIGGVIDALENIKENKKRKQDDTE